MDIQFCQYYLNYKIFFFDIKKVFLIEENEEKREIEKMKKEEEKEKEKKKRKKK